ncbi:MAG: hypothetical protein OEV97_04215 [Betaproteobacteria bacterium]|nr:hypothetical protein [Betaproteobacteria bacterium]
MILSAREFRQLALPLLACIALLAAGSGLITWTEGKRVAEERMLTAARAERSQTKERLMRIAEEEKEVKEKLDIYQRLKAIGILGEEQRLEWADTMARIRTERELPDLRYRVERQLALKTVPGKPANVEFYASKMVVSLALLHEGDLLHFLGDLRASGNAYYAVRRCTLARTGQPAAITGLSPRVRAECEIDLITILDRAAKA